jgi:hypothetical protein
MKQTGITILYFFAATMAYPQKLSLNAGYGIINYGGDIQEKIFTFNESNQALTAGVAYKLSNYFSAALSVTTGKLSASDEKKKISICNVVI